MHSQIIRGIQPSFSSSSAGRVIVGGQPWELTARAGECFVVYPQPFCRFYHCVGEAREAGYRGLSCPQQIIPRSDAVQCRLLGRADTEGFGWGGTEE